MNLPAVPAPSPDEVREAARLLAEWVPATPLLPADPLGGRPPHPLRLKAENLQPTGSFKVRGVLAAVARMDPERRRAGVSTVSAGNTAQALAWAARLHGVPARSIMPDSAPRTKVEALRRLGATPVLVPRAEVFRYLRERLWEREPYGFVHPWTDPNLITGHGTLALELLDACPDLRRIYVPVGGGGLLAGVGSVLRALAPEVRIVAVEPEGCPSLARSLEAGRPVEVACRTLCDGVAVPYVADEIFPLLQRLVDRSILVPEQEVRRAMFRLATGHHLVAEGAGALAYAAALRDGAVRGDAPSVAVVSGGNVDADVLAEVLRHPAGGEAA